MRVIDTDIPDVKLLEPERVGDARGFFSEVYSRRALGAAGIDTVFVQDNHSLSGPVGTLRGLHFQKPPHAQCKLIRVTRGSVLDVAVDIRAGSPTFGGHTSAVLSADNWLQMFVPVGFAHGFVTLERDTEVLYKVSDGYAPDCDAGVIWDDPDLAIDWRLDGTQPTLSDKDTRLPRLSELDTPFRYEPAD